MIKRKITLLVSTVLSLGLAVSCDKSGNGPEGRSLLLSFSPGGCSPTRATLYGDAAGFADKTIHVTAFSGSDQKIDDTAVRSGDVWETEGKYFFDGTGVVLGIYAYYPSDLTLKTRTGASLSFSHSVASSASSQSDIMMGYSSETLSGTDMTASISLGHALTSLTFKYGDVPESGLEITGITVSGVIGSGTCTFTGSTSGFEWTEKTGTTAVEGSTTVTPAKDAPLGADATFTLIPQSWGTDAKPSITIDYKNDSASGSYTYTLPDNSSWERGSTYTFAINFNQLALTVRCEDFNGGTWYSHDATGTGVSNFSGDTWN